MTNVVAQAGWWCSDHMASWGGWAMWAGMTLFWLVVIALAIWAFTRSSSTSRPSPSTSAEELLAARFARGEIDADEYHERLGELRR